MIGIHNLPLLVDIGLTDLPTSQFPLVVGWRKSTSYIHKTTIWVFHEYYLNPEFHKILSRSFLVIPILGFSPYAAIVVKWKTQIVVL